MSRIGRQLIEIPDKVSVEINKDQILVKGPKGELQQVIPSFFKVEEKDKILSCSVQEPENKKQRAIWGTLAKLISNMVIGVNKGFEKQLELVGIGYRAQVNGQNLVLNISFSHPVEYFLPKGIDAKVEKNIITLTGIDRQLVGETAAQIRRFRKPEPYKGTGIRYVGEVIRRKAGKKVGATAGGA